MTLSELRALVREYLDEPTEAFYSNSVINTFLNESYRDLYKLLGRLNNDYTLKEATGNMTSGTGYVDVPEDLLSIVKVGVRDSGASSDDSYSFLRYWDKQSKGVFTDSDSEPVYFWYDIANRRLYFYPTPDDDYEYFITYKTKLITSDLMSNDTDSPSKVPEDYHLWLVYNTVLRLLPKDRDNSIEQTLLMMKQDLEIRMAEELINAQPSSIYLRGWRG